MSASPRTLAVTFAGGGNRAFYQVGFLERWWPALEPRIGAISACSAGASVIVSWLSGRRDATHQYWLRRRAAVTRNFQWERLLVGKRPTPHTPIYRDTLRFALADGGFERIKALPFPLLILTASPPPVPVPLAVLVGIGAYSLERKLNRGKLHPGAARRLGFRPVALDARQCRTPEELAELILASSATPPFTPVGRIAGRPVLDGGLVDNAPAFLAESVPGVERTLVLLTRPYPRDSLGWKGSRLYLAPSGTLPISRWDYTSLERVEATLAMGRREAEVLENIVTSFMDPSAASSQQPTASSQQPIATS
ncbi:MAG TPA: patatin-like phospholipase family protein [Gemmatimonadales bacterium]